jgi:hypothetical protein
MFLFQEPRSVVWWIDFLTFFFFETTFLKSKKEHVLTQPLIMH